MACRGERRARRYELVAYLRVLARSPFPLLETLIFAIAQMQTESTLAMCKYRKHELLLLLFSEGVFKFFGIGNLFNSEIIGKQCSYFFCVAFPLSGYGLIPRHPVQVYECIIYFTIFLFVRNLKSKNSFEPGRISLFVVTLAFIGRFLVEFYKEKQSDIIFAYINMGQLLSFLSFLLFFFVYFYTARGLNNEKGRIIN